MSAGEAFMRMFDEPKAAAVRAKLPIPPPDTAVPAPEVAHKRPAVPPVPKDELMEVWSGGKLGRKRSRQDFSQVPPSPPQNGHPTLHAALSAKAERRRFMSGKAADVHRPAAPQAQPQKRRRVLQPEGSGLNREDFLNMQREVQTFGAEALDKKQRKHFDAWQLQSVKAAPQKPGRVSAAIGKGIAKKQAERDQKVKEEAIASGMLPVKGSGKHKNRSNVDKGLVEDGGLFKAGMLRVKSTALGKSTSRKRKGILSQRRAFSSGKIGNLDGNSQKAWNVASSQQAKKKGPLRKGRK
ncbi:hypothetical protein ABBQ32_006527 [Trebouxia sp. C0010 RCD-2024]